MMEEPTFNGDEISSYPAERHYAVAFAVVGLFYALIMTFLANWIGGAGHGWGTPSISGYSIFFLPILGIAGGYRTRTGGRLTAATILVIGILLDLIILGEAMRSESHHYISRVWSAIPFIFLSWIFLWILWQSVAALIVIRRVA